MSFASKLGRDARPVIEEAARHAFANAHSLTLTTAAALIALLTVVIFRQLGQNSTGAAQ